MRGIDGRLYTSDQATIWRWRTAFQNDFAARMHWTVADFKDANHNPVAIVNGQRGTAPILLDAEVGRPVTLDAGASHDPDGQPLTFHWFAYPEAGGTGGNLSAVTLTGPDTARATVTPAAVCHEDWIPGILPCKGEGVAHIILAVTDNGSPQLTSYRRIVLHVHSAEAEK